VGGVFIQNDHFLPLCGIVALGKLKLFSSWSNERWTFDVLNPFFFFSAFFVPLCEKLFNNTCGAISNLNLNLLAPPALVAAMSP
jgi:hypothetical protein